MGEVLVQKEFRYAIESALGFHRPDLDQQNLPHIAKVAADAFAKELMIHPIIPNDEQGRQLYLSTDPHSGYLELIKAVAIEWQRRMFRPPEPAPVGFVECDTCHAKPGSPTLCAGCFHNRDLIEKLTGRMTTGRYAPEPDIPMDAFELAELRLPFDEKYQTATCALTVNQRINEAWRRAFRLGQNSGPNK